MECKHGEPRGERYCALCRYESGQGGGYTLISGRRSIDSNYVSIAANPRSTSLKAVEKAFPKSGTKRRTTYELIKEAGMYGMCDHEIEQATGWVHQSASSVRNSLMKDGWIQDSGIRRKTPQGNDSIAWVVVD